MKHGTQYAYRNGCHCPDCKAWNAASKKRWRRNRIAKGIERMVRGKWETVPDSQLQS